MFDNNLPINQQVPAYLNDEPTDNPYHFELMIDEENHQFIGKRLDYYLANCLPFSRGIVQRWVEQKEVYVNGQAKHNNYRLKADDEIVVDAQPLPSDLAFSAENIALKCVYEDDDLLIIHKPIGMVCHPAPGNWQHTLVNALLYHYPQTVLLPRAGLVHRLDKMTSGLLVVAKHLSSYTALVAQLQQRLFKREYLAIVRGLLTHSGTVDQPIARHPILKTKMAIVPVGKGGKLATTHYKSIKVDVQNNCTLVHCQLETGRTHQIRVHMTSIGYDLLGDILYGKDTTSVFYQMQRQALHAFKLTLTQPITGNLICVEVLPEDEMLNVLKPMLA